MFRVLALLTILHGCTSALADDNHFTQKIQPLLKTHCLKCHGEGKLRGGFDVRTLEAILAGSQTGKVVVPGHADASLLVQLVAVGGEPHMPPNGQLSKAEIADLQTWINALKATDAKETKGRDHWAFQKLKPVDPPKVKNTDWVKNSIDAFILAPLEAKGWKPAKAASRPELIRRVYFDLIGLPPTPEEIAAACKDASDDWLRKVVDRLLDSPQYGERWGRHWLDLARYADSGGFHSDLDRPQAWRYRDYVIRSFNEDKPFAQFIREQLAGDEIDPSNPDFLAATGFCISGPSNDDNMGVKIEKYRLEQLDDVISTTGNVFLGLTIGCARCHDHKYDPLPQEDYYRFLAIFNNVERREIPLTEGKVDPAQAKVSSKKPVFKGDYISFLTEPSAKARKTHLLWRGNFENRGPEVNPGVPTALVGKSLDFPASAASTSKRRTVLAEWLASPENPLTYRVMVNRLWQHHFGRGIVASSSNFGVTGDRPTHPELLDWLAGELIKNGGRFKAMHRMMILSSTYQQASRWDEPGLEKVDPQNQLLARMNKRRLEAEAIRDSILAVSGKLNLKMGGPGIKPRMHPDLLAGSQRNKWPNVAKEGPDLWRRSVYVYIKRQLLLMMLQLFDAPSSNQSCGRREESTVPTQALILMNDDFVNDQAGFFAERVMKDAGNDPGRRIERCFQLALSQTPSETRVKQAREFLEERKQTYEKAGKSSAEAETQSLTDLCHVLFNCNEFVYVE